MKINFLRLAVLLLFIAGCKPVSNSVEKSDAKLAVYDSLDQTNDFYDNETVVDLPGANVIEVVGEVAQPKTISISDLPIRSVIVKETTINEGEVKFVGAYRYDGVSLYDILNSIDVVKKNAAEFNPIIDQYVVVYNSLGDSVVISWGELYYPVQRHQILIANKVIRIVPSKTKDKWPLPDKSRLIIGSDLITERNISDPVKIAIRSVGINYKVDRTLKLWAPEMVLEGIGSKSINFNQLPEGFDVHRFDNVFYGRGMGIHGITSFKGGYLKDMLVGMLPADRNLIRNGLFVIAAVDGYRCSVTYSELMNRNDNAEVIIIDEENYEDAGKFSCLFTADFFSDRAIKSITEIRLISGKNGSE
jgi:hypothetical protein